MLPENRFDAETMNLVNNLVETPLNMNFRYMRADSSFIETLFVDHLQLIDDTSSWFMRN